MKSLKITPIVLLVAAFGLLFSACSEDETEQEPPVSPTAAGQLAISEIMASPITVADPAGEWFEIFNPGAANFDLNGCVISDTGTDTHTIASLMVINRGAYGTLAGGATPGFAPGYVYLTAEFSLNNAPPDDIILTCGLVEIDRVTYDGTFPAVPAGTSLAVQNLAANSTFNDFGINWCGAATPYATDLGTPGAANDCGAPPPPILISVAVTPSPSSVNVASNLQFTATGTFSDSSTSNLTATATWTSTNGAIAMVNATGLATGVAPGTVTITALDVGSGLSGTSILTVNAGFVSEGSVALPLDIGPAIINGAKTYNGQVGPTPSNSYYVTPVPAGTWDVSMFGLLANADLEVHSTNAFNVGSLLGASVNAGTANESVLAITCPDGPGSCLLYFNIIGVALGGTSFTLTVPISGGFINSEGTPEVPLNLGLAPVGARFSSVAAISDSHYQFVTNSLTGTFTISGLASDLDLFLFDTLANLQAGTLSAITSSEQFLLVDESVGYTCAVGPCTFYITVLEFDGFAGNFTIDITEP